MNDYQTKMYNDLMTLVDTSEAFFFKDHQCDTDTSYRIFNYRLSSYTEFLLPSALECRGHTFVVDAETGEALRLASLPMEKFFNYMENPFTMELDLNGVVEIADKADGSLITTFTHDGYLMLKSKGSLNSEQAVAASAFLLLPEQESLRLELIALERNGFTVIMEWTAPENRIVLGYMEAGLIILGVRLRDNGEYLSHNDVDEYKYPTVLARWTKVFNVADPLAFLDLVPDMKDDIEGFVAIMNTGQRVKFKTLKYLALHHTKDSINTPRRLYEAVLEEATDDMRTMFVDDPLAIKMIAEMETFVDEKYNHLVDTVERYYERNKAMERKDYAILGQSELTKIEFGLVMQLYTGNTIDYKEVMKKRWKSFGVKDEKIEVEA